MKKKPARQSSLDDLRHRVADLESVMPRYAQAIAALEGDRIRTKQVDCNDSRTTEPIKPPPKLPPVGSVWVYVDRNTCSHAAVIDIASGGFVWLQDVGLLNAERFAAWVNKHDAKMVYSPEAAQ